MARNFRMDFKNPPKAQTVRRYDGKDVHVKSSNEAKFADWLNFLYKCSGIVAWQYEPREFTFPRRRGVTCYRPDFRVLYPMDPDQDEPDEAYFECKVSLVQKDITKFKLMAKHYPGVPLVLVMDRRPKAIKRRLIIADAAKHVARVMYRSESCRPL